MQRTRAPQCGLPGSLPVSLTLHLRNSHFANSIKCACCGEVWLCARREQALHHRFTRKNAAVPPTTCDHAVALVTRREIQLDSLDCTRGVVKRASSRMIVA